MKNLTNFHGGNRCGSASEILCYFLSSDIQSNTSMEGGLLGLRVLVFGKKMWRPTGHADLCCLILYVLVEKQKKGEKMWSASVCILLK